MVPIFPLPILRPVVLIASTRLPTVVEMATSGVRPML